MDLITFINKFFKLLLESFYPPGFVRITELRTSVSITGNKVIDQLVSYMKLLVKHVDRIAVFECSWEHGIGKWTTEKLNGMY